MKKGKGALSVAEMQMNRDIHPLNIRGEAMVNLFYDSIFKIIP